MYKFSENFKIFLALFHTLATAVVITDEHFDQLHADITDSTSPLHPPGTFPEIIEGEHMRNCSSCAYVQIRNMQ